MTSDGSIVNPDATVIRENTTGAVIYYAEATTRHEVPGQPAQFEVRRVKKAHPLTAIVMNGQRTSPDYS